MAALFQDSIISNEQYCTLTLFNRVLLQVSIVPVAQGWILVLFSEISCLEEVHVLISYAAIGLRGERS